MAIIYDVKCAMCETIYYRGERTPNPKKVEVINDVTEYEYYSDNNPSLYRTSHIKNYLCICHINICDKCYAKLADDMRIRRIEVDREVSYTWQIAKTEERRERDAKNRRDAEERREKDAKNRREAEERSRKKYEEQKRIAIQDYVLNDNLTNYTNRNKAPNLWPPKGYKTTYNQKKPSKKKSILNDIIDSEMIFISILVVCMFIAIIIYNYFK